MAIGIKFWGTRGGVPVSGPHVRRHGGATTHIEIDLGERVDYDRVLIDCGTGVVGLGYQAPAAFDDLLVLQTHVHWDHVQGFPFFQPLFDSSASLEFWGADREGKAVETIYAEQMRRPNFPVGMETVAADLEFDRIPREGSRSVGEVTIRWIEVEHPSGSSAFRIESGDDVFVFSGDVEVQRNGDEELVEFFAGADVLLMDAQYLPDEYDAHEGFGHSTCGDAVRVAEKAGVSRLYLTHHDPAHDDDTLDHKLEVARSLAGEELYVDNARDRQRIDLPVREEPRELSSAESDVAQG